MTERAGLILQYAVIFGFTRIYTHLPRIKTPSSFKALRGRKMIVRRDFLHLTILCHA